MRNKIISEIEKEKIIVIVRGVSADKLIPMAEAMYNGGIRLLEITYDARGIVTDEETAKNIEALAKRFEGRMFIGAGTVLTEKQAELTKSAGGSFIISPDTCEGIIAKTRELEMVSIPGAMTPSEIQAAHRYGADFIKLFPINSLGTDYVRNVKAPLSHTKLLAVGGITENNIKEYLDAGISGFGIGGCIADKSFIANNEFDKITELAKRFTTRLRKY